MVLKKRKFEISVFFLLLFLISITHGYAQEKLEQYLEIELKRLEETYTLLDTFAEQVWPGWNNYLGIQFRVQFPNLVFLIVNPMKEVPEGYELVPGRTVRGKKIYLNRKEELPIKLEPPLTGGGQGDTNIRIGLRETKVKSRLKDQPKENQTSIKKGVSSDNQILLYVHEFFHTFQEKVWKGWGKEKGDRKFTVNTEYAAYSEIEGKALFNAYTEKDDAKALEYLKDYIVAREIKHRYMTPEAIQHEKYTNLEEGTAVYAETKMAMLIKERGYKSKMNQEDDPFFLGFKYVDEYISRKTTAGMNFILNMTLDRGMKYYTFGALESHLLDRFVPDWKKGFIENYTDLDDKMRAFLKLPEEEKKHIAEKFKSKYQFDEIYAKHGAVIKEKDDAIELIKSRKGKKYIVDFKKTKEFFNIMSRGKSVRIGVEQIFLHGIKKLTMGEIELVSKDTPMHRPWIWTVEWVDTEAKEGEKGYDLKYEKQVEDVYKNVTFTTNGFTLKAPEAKIEEKENEVKIIILSKVSR